MVCIGSVRRLTSSNYDKALTFLLSTINYYYLEFLSAKSDDVVFSCLYSAFEVWCYVKVTVAMRAGLCVVSFGEASALGKCCIVLSDVG